MPTIAWQLIEHPARANYDLSSLESVAYGGAPSAPELVRKIVETFPKLPARQRLGHDRDHAPPSPSHMAEDYEHRPDSCGPAVPVGDMKICDPADGRELPPGVGGRALGQGPAGGGGLLEQAGGHGARPSSTAGCAPATWRGSTRRASCFIIDRAKDMLIRGGENIYCVEVENALYEHPAVMDAAVVGIPHKTLGEEPGAVVTLKPGADATEDELRDFVRRAAGGASRSR